MKIAMMLTTTAYMSERFNRDNILILNKLGYKVDVVANWKQGNPMSEDAIQAFKNWLEETGNEWTNVSIVRNPLASSNRRALKDCLGLVDEKKYDLIHCHTPVASVLGRVVAHKTNTLVIYTAHGFHFFDGAPMLNWLMFYPVEKVLSRWTDVLIAINAEDYNRANSKFHARRLERVYGVGVDTKKFSQDEAVRLKWRKNLGLSDDEIMLLSVGELSERKNHQVVIKALSEMKNKKIKYFIAGQGNLQNELENLVIELGLKDQVTLLGYRTDVSELNQAADIFVLPSKQEGVSVAVMEAMGCNTRVVGSRIRGNVDLISDEETLFEYDDISDVKRAIEKGIDKLGEDTDYKDVLKRYDIVAVNEEMERIYRSVL